MMHDYQKTLPADPATKDLPWEMTKAVVESAWVTGGEFSANTRAKVTLVGYSKIQTSGLR
jgi:hypothetical protein